MVPGSSSSPVIPVIWWMTKDERWMVPFLTLWAQFHLVHSRCWWRIAVSPQLKWLHWTCDVPKHPGDRNIDSNLHSTWDFIWFYYDFYEIMSFFGKHKHILGFGHRLGKRQLWCFANAKHEWQPRTTGSFTRQIPTSTLFPNASARYWEIWQ